MAARNTNKGKSSGGFEVIAQHGDLIPTQKGTEFIAIQHVRVNGVERVEVRGRYRREDGREGNISLTDNFGRRTTLTLAVESADALDTLIAALESVRDDFTETPKADKAEAEEAAKPPVKKVTVNKRGRAMTRKTGARKAS